MMVYAACCSSSSYNESSLKCCIYVRCVDKCKFVFQKSVFEQTYSSSYNITATLLLRTNVVRNNEKCTVHTCVLFVANRESR
jgi:hypothetical protein